MLRSLTMFERSWHVASFIWKNKLLAIRYKRGSCEPDETEVGDVIVRTNKTSKQECPADVCSVKVKIKIKILLIMFIIIIIFPSHFLQQ